MAKVAGRKLYSPVWDYFEYDPPVDKSKQAMVMKTGGNILYNVTKREAI